MWLHRSDIVSSCDYEAGLRGNEGVWLSIGDVATFINGCG